MRGFADMNQFNSPAIKLKLSFLINQLCEHFILKYILQTSIETTQVWSILKVKLTVKEKEFAHIYYNILTHFKLI